MAQFWPWPRQGPGSPAPAPRCPSPRGCSSPHPPPAQPWPRCPQSHRWWWLGLQTIHRFSQSRMRSLLGMMLIIMMMMAVRGPRVRLLERGPARHGLHQQRALLLRRVRQHLPGRGSVDIDNIDIQIFSIYEAQCNYLFIYLKWSII